MSTMPNLIGFSLDYAEIVLSAISVSPIIAYRKVTAPTTVGMILAQSPDAGQTIMGDVTLIIPGGITFPKLGVTVFSQPALLVSPIVIP